MEKIDPRAEEVLAFWFAGNDRDPRWFAKDAAFDAAVRERFLNLYEDGVRGALASWLNAPRTALALVILLDQFPRNMFRGTARSFASDALALAAAREAVRRGYDRDLRPCERMFLYLPYQHSESAADQRTSVELCAPLGNYPETHDVPRYAVAHRDIIERFGRFPHRNAVLGRDSTPEEIEFLKQPGSSF